MSSAPANTESARSMLEKHLEQRYRELFEEVRHYPTPIAHCDDQLPWLIEQRTHALSQLQALREAASSAALQTLLAGYPRSADEVEMALVNQLGIALRRNAKSPQPVIPSAARNLLLDQR